MTIRDKMAGKNCLNWVMRNWNRRVGMEKLRVYDKCLTGIGA